MKSVSNLCLMDLGITITTSFTLVNDKLELNEPELMKI